MRVVTVVLSFAMVVSQFSVASAATTQSPLVHVALTQDNLLRGQLVMRGGQPVSGVDISISSGQAVVCRATTDDRGVFAARVERGGVYVLSDGETSAVVAAKPAAPFPIEKYERRHDKSYQIRSVYYVGIRSQ